MIAKQNSVVMARQTQMVRTILQAMPMMKPVTMETMLMETAVVLCVRQKFLPSVVMEVLMGTKNVMTANTVRMERSVYWMPIAQIARNVRHAAMMAVQKPVSSSSVAMVLSNLHANSAIRD